MTEIVLASNNRKKIAELETLLEKCASKTISVKTLRDIGYTDEIVEDGTSFEENSLIKAGTPAKLGYIGIADDSGLCVDFLGGKPGIYSARYSGVCLHSLPRPAGKLTLRYPKGVENIVGAGREIRHSRKESDGGSWNLPRSYPHGRARRRRLRIRPAVLLPRV